MSQQQQGSNKFAYARDGQLGLLKMVLSQEGASVDVNAVDEDGRTLLHWASGAGHLEVVEYLLSVFGASVSANTADEEGWTPLLSACSAGRLGVARRLASAGARGEARTSSGGTALHFASSKGHADVAAFVAQQWPALVAARDARGDTPLHKAARSAAATTVLLEQKADVSARNKRGRTPLHDAAEDAAQDVCKILLEHGADPDARDEEGSTPRTLGGQALEDLWPKKKK